MITGSGNFFSSGADLKGGNVDPLTGETYERADGTPVYMEYLPRAPIARSAAALSQLLSPCVRAADSCRPAAQASRSR